MNVKDVLIDVLNEEKQTMADEYIRVKEMLDFIQMYFEFNVDDLAEEEIQHLSIDLLRQVMNHKINHYKKYVKTDKVGVYALAKDEA
jgi:hypothetical protein